MSLRTARTRTARTRIARTRTRTGLSESSYLTRKRLPAPACICLGYIRQPCPLARGIVCGSRVDGVVFSGGKSAPARAPTLPRTAGGSHCMASRAARMRRRHVEPAWAGQGRPLRFTRTDAANSAADFARIARPRRAARASPRRKYPDVLLTLARLRCPPPPARAQKAPPARARGAPPARMARASPPSKPAAAPPPRFVPPAGRSDGARRRRPSPPLPRAAEADPDWLTQTGQPSALGTR